jgi:hypothetical protein
MLPALHWSLLHRTHSADVVVDADEVNMDVEDTVEVDMVVVDMDVEHMDADMDMNADMDMGADIKVTIPSQITEEVNIKIKVGPTPTIREDIHMETHEDDINTTIPIPLEASNIVTIATALGTSEMTVSNCETRCLKDSSNTSEVSKRKDKLL